MDKPSDYKKHLLELKTISEYFKSDESIGIDDIESNFKKAQNSYEACMSRINEVKALIEGSMQ